MRIVYTVLDGRMSGGQVVCGQVMVTAMSVGHQVCLVTPSLGEFTEMLESHSIKIIQMPMERTFYFHRAVAFAKFLRDWLIHSLSVNHNYEADNISRKIGLPKR